MDPVTAIIVSHVAVKLVDQFIKEEGYQRAKRLIFPKKRYRNRLIQIIYEVIDEHEKKFPQNPKLENLPFYHSQLLFEELNGHILFKSKKSKNLIEKFKGNSKIIVPSEKELSEFYDSFVKRINADSELKKLHIEENYKSEIFEISSLLNSIDQKLESLEGKMTTIEDYVIEKKEKEESEKITSEKSLEALNKQVKRQLKKQLNSGKYLPDTFIETTNGKDLLRYLVDPMLYIGKCFNEVSILDFRLLNKHLEKKGMPEFKLEWEQYRPGLDRLTISNHEKYFAGLLDHIEKKESEIINEEDRKSDYSSWVFEKKFRNAKESFKFLRTKVALITEAAGQGKTNFLCDFSDNFLNGREVPHMFLTGVELNAKDIRAGILKSVFPDNSNTNFSEFIDSIKKTCYEQNKFFVIVIDGINENSETKTLSKNIEQFISEILDHDFIRVILSCRTEYFDHNFLNLTKSSFSNDMQHIDTLISKRPHPEDEVQEKLLWTYFNYFKIEAKELSHKVYDQLTANFLLLRIFCEAYKNQNLGVIDDIYKEELFEHYYSLKVDEINGQRNHIDDFKVSANFDIKRFISKVIQFMVVNKSYVNVPLDTILQEDENKEVYVRFLDENILIKRDPVENESNTFGYSEVVNFTFDEFRDYLISNYLVHELYINKEEEFKLFLKEGLTEKSPILEGCSTFLFFEGRKLSKAGLSMILKEQVWYDSVFRRCVFNLKDGTITKDEVNRVLELIKTSADKSTKMVFGLIIRNDIDIYKNLNIFTLIEFLRSLNQEEFDHCFVSAFGDKYSRMFKIDQDQLLDRMEEVLDTDEIETTPRYHNTFELLLYLFTNKGSWKVQQIYERYFYKYSENSKDQLKKAMDSNNQNLVAEITLFMKEYDIEL